VKDVNVFDALDDSTTDSVHSQPADRQSRRATALRFSQQVRTSALFPGKLALAGSLTPLSEEQNLWEYVAQVFYGPHAVLSQPLTAARENKITDPNQGKSSTLLTLSCSTARLLTLPLHWLSSTSQYQYTLH